MPTPTRIPLAQITLTASDNEIVFSSIPNTYQDLILVVEPRASAGMSMSVRLNSDSGANYNRIGMWADGTSPNGFKNTNTDVVLFIGGWEANDSAVAIAQLMDYKSTNRQKVVLARSHRLGASNQTSEAIVSRWANTAAVHTVTCTANNSNFAAGSTFTLFGVH